MTTLTVRKVSDELHRSLKLRAAKNGRSAEAEVRDILSAALKPPAPWLSQLREAGREIDALLQGDDWLPARRKKPFVGENLAELK